LSAAGCEALIWSIGFLTFPVRELVRNLEQESGFDATPNDNAERGDVKKHSAHCHVKIKSANTGEFIEKGISRFDHTPFFRF
jgi:hypothetical protein